MSMTKCTSLFLATALVAAGCSDDDGGASPDAGDTPRADAGETAQADADPDAPDAGAPADAGAGDTATVVSVGASGEVGVVSTVGVPSLAIDQDVSAGIAGSDAVVRRIGDAIYILNRGQGNVTIVDGDLQLDDQISVGGGANPHDVARLGDTLYVSGYATAGVLVVDANDPGAGVIETIDLSFLEPDTGEPNCSALFLHGDTLLAACQRLDGEFSPVGAGVVAVIDTDDHSVETFELARENPLSRFVATPTDGPIAGDLLIASVGDFTPENSCIERISLDPEPASEGCLVEGVDIGGFVSRVEVDGDRLWLVASRADFSAFVAAYDLDQEELAEPLTGAEHSPNDVAVCPEGEVVVADYPFGDETAGGLRIFDGGAEITADALDVGAVDVFAHGLICF